MKFGKRHISLHASIVLVVCIVVIVALSVTGILIGVNEASDTRTNLSEKAMTIAQTVALSPMVIDALEGKRSRQDVDTFAAEVRRQTGVRFIVVMDMNHVRLSHPTKSLIGKRFVGGDENAAMQGKSYISVAEGTLGPSLRAFMPIRGEDGKQVGVVAVGIMLNRVQEAVAQSERIIYLGIGVGIIIGVFGALVLARKIKNILFGLEPSEIAKLWQERNAILESVREGILAVNREGVIILANAEATRMFGRSGVDASPIGSPVESFVPNSGFQSVLEQGAPGYDEEYDWGGNTYVVNRVPITVNDEVVGVVGTFRDKTELKQLAEQLTGVKLYAEALRVQAHEFMNKLHVILGMAHTGNYSRLSSYIHQITDRYHMEVGSISRLVKDPVIAGFLLSKLSFAREHDVNLEISGDCSLPIAGDPRLTDELVTILGNLLDNGFEAVEGAGQKEIHVTLGYDGSLLSVEVRDNGNGIPPELQEAVFRKGFSTKGENRGYGLFLVKRSIETLGGSLKLRTRNGWTTFTVSLPYREKDEEEV